MRRGEDSNMNKAKERLITIVTMIAIALICVPVLCFGLGSNASVKTAWKVTPHVNTSTGAPYSDSVIYSLSESAKEAYVYVGNVYNAPNDKIEMTLITSDSLDSIKGGDYFFLSKKVCSFNVKKGEYPGWVKLNFSGSLNSKYVKISTAQSFEFFEVGFINEKKEKIDVKCIGGIVWKNGNHKFVEVSTQADTFALTCDEQGGFVPQKGLNSLTKEELRLSGAIDNFLNVKGGYVSQSDNPLGVILPSIGVAIFGNGPFGLRIIGFLFFVATLYLLFFFAKKLFSSSVYGIIAVLLYLFVGLGLSLVTRSSALSISTFFLIASFYFSFAFYKKSTDAKKTRINSNYLLLCGLTFALAISVSLYSVFALPALLIICLIPSIKAIIETRKTYILSSGLEKEYAREKYNRTLSKVILKSALGFIVMPIALIVISYGIAYPTYVNYYQTNFIKAIALNHANAFKNSSDGLFAAWAIGLGSSAMQTPFGHTAYLMANRVLSAISCISVAVIGVMYILEKGDSILNGKLLVALKENKSNYVLILTAFLSTWLMNIFFLGSSNYASFAITLAIAVLSLTLLYKLLKNCMSKGWFKVLNIVAITLIVGCFILQLPFLFSFDLPKDLQVIYNWLV